MMIPFVFNSHLQHLMPYPLDLLPTFPLQLMLYDFMTFMIVPFLWLDSPSPSISLPPPYKDLFPFFFIRTYCFFTYRRLSFIRLFIVAF